MPPNDNNDMVDIPAEIFISLRRHFFDEAGRPQPFALRPKRNTQDDPFDEHIAQDVLASLPGLECARAPGPLITPDMVLFRPDRCRGVGPAELVADLDCIVGLEVKKLERTRQGTVARASGLDYNTTPPCGRVRVYDARNRPVDIRSFYLFLCLERYPEDPAQVMLTALIVVDGNVLNSDFELYLSIVGEREKRINLGTYRDGVDRARPMLIFANPLGAVELSRAVTLIHPSPTLDTDTPELRPLYDIRRTLSEGNANSFYCYCSAADVPGDCLVSTLTDPFPTPSRVVKTQARGRFKLPFKL